MNYLKTIKIIDQTLENAMNASTNSNDELYALYSEVNSYVYELENDEAIETEATYFNLAIAALNKFNLISIK